MEETTNRYWEGFTPANLQKVINLRNFREGRCNARERLQKILKDQIQFDYRLDDSKDNYYRKKIKDILESILTKIQTSLNPAVVQSQLGMPIEVFPRDTIEEVMHKNTVAIGEFNRLSRRSPAEQAVEDAEQAVEDAKQILAATIRKEEREDLLGKVKALDFTDKKNVVLFLLEVKNYIRFDRGFDRVIYQNIEEGLKNKGITHQTDPETGKNEQEKEYLTIVVSALQGVDNSTTDAAEEFLKKHFGITPINNW